jgi:hypothetical protein
MLGYSYQVTPKHAAEAGNTWAQYFVPVAAGRHPESGVTPP